MKRKKFNKKLVLNKKAISNLNMRNVKGGDKDMVTNEVMSCDGGCISGWEYCP